MFTPKKFSKNKSNKKSTKKRGKSINKPELAVDLGIDTSIDASNKGFTLSKGINRKLESGRLDRQIDINETHQLGDLLGRGEQQSMFEDPLTVGTGNLGGMELPDVLANLGDIENDATNALEKLFGAESADRQGRSIWMGEPGDTGIYELMQSGNPNQTEVSQANQNDDSMSQESGVHTPGPEESWSGNIHLPDGENKAFKRAEWVKNADGTTTIYEIDNHNHRTGRTLNKDGTVATNPDGTPFNPTFWEKWCSTAMGMGGTGAAAFIVAGEGLKGSVWAGPIVSAIVTVGTGVSAIVVGELYCRIPNPMDDNSVDPGSTFKDPMGLIKSKDRALTELIKSIKPKIDPLTEGGHMDNDDYVNVDLEGFNISHGGSSTGVWEEDGGKYIGVSIDAWGESSGGTSTGDDVPVI